jgi:arylsulfatase
MRGAKATPWRGGVRACSFWRWPGTLTPSDRGQLTAHVDVLPTLAELAGARLPEEVARGLDGRSLVPLLRDAGADWPERFLFTHVGRRARGQAAESKYAGCAVRHGHYHLVRTSGPGDPTLHPGAERLG